MNHLDGVNSYIGRLNKNKKGYEFRLVVADPNWFCFWVKKGKKDTCIYATDNTDKLVTGICFLTNFLFV